jgi:hypothetical protein
MNCHRFEECVNDIARRQMIDASARDQAFAHADECEGCARRLEEERRLTTCLQMFAAVTSTDAPPRGEAQLLEAFEQHTSLRSRQFVNSRRRWIAAAAAALLIIAGGAGIRWRRSLSLPPNNVTVEKPQPRDNVLTSLNPPLIVRRNEPEKSEKPSQRHTISHRNKRPESLAKASTASDSKREIATAFFPINYGGANLDEGGRVVRVDLPRSALAHFGLPVNMDRANERIKADLLLGVDGLPHAIRFVQ